MEEHLYPKPITHSTAPANYNIAFNLVSVNLPIFPMYAL